MLVEFMIIRYDKHIPRVAVGIVNKLLVDCMVLLMWINKYILMDDVDY